MKTKKRFRWGRLLATAITVVIAYYAVIKFSYTKIMQLQIGDKAPEFVGVNQEGQTIGLSDFAGKKLVLYFYPKDNTFVCTKQACNLKKNYEALKQAGYEIIGVSRDSVEAHQKFIKERNLPFSLISDKDQTIHKQYGVWVQKSLFGKKYWGPARVTFVIDEQGKIENIIDKVKASEHTLQILGKPSANP